MTPGVPAPPVSVAFDQSHTRAAFRLFHPKGNSLTVEMIGVLRAALESIGEYPRPDLMQTAGAVEGLAAFLERRSPRWLDRFRRLTPINVGRRRRRM